MFVPSIYLAAMSYLYCVFRRNPPCSSSTKRYISMSRSVTRRTSYSDSAFFRALEPSDERNEGFFNRRTMDSANATELLNGTTNPFTSWSLTAQLPGISDTTHGSPQLIASSRALDMPSKRDGNTNSPALR